jgi:hypothetical protein
LFFIIEWHYQSFVSIKETCVFEIYIYKKEIYHNIWFAQICKKDNTQVKQTYEDFSYIQ